MASAPAAFKAGAALFAREDAGCGVDAGDRIETAKIIAPVLYGDNCLGGDDRKDLFGFWGEKGETYAIEAEANNGAEVFLRLKVFPEETQKVMAGATGEGRVTIGKIQIPRDDYYFFEVSLERPANEIVPYSLTLNRVAD